MRSGGRGGGDNSGARPPPQPIYRPGSGPLRKSGRSMDDIDTSSHSSNQGKSNYNNLMKIGNLSNEFQDIHINKKYNSDSEPRKHDSIVDSRRKNKKPEQQLYVPKKLKEALQEVCSDPGSPLQFNREKSWNRDDSLDREHNHKSNRHDRDKTKTNNHGKHWRSESPQTHVNQRDRQVN